MHFYSEKSGTDQSIRLLTGQLLQIYHWSHSSRPQLLQSIDVERFFSFSSKINKKGENYHLTQRFLA